MRYLAIRTENLTKEYHRRRALSNLTLEVEPGEVFGLLGPKGAGKSTFIKILLDIVRPTHGNALVMGLDSQRQSMRIRKLVGYLPEVISFSSGVTGNQLIARLARVRPALDPCQVDQLASRFGLNLDRQLSTCPISEQRKFGLILAVMHQPDLLILDEPTSGLSKDAQFDLYTLIAELRNQGSAILYSTASLAEVERVCDRVAVLHNGSLVTVERGVQMRARAMRKVEMRFASPVRPEWFAGLTNLNNIICDQNKFFCTLQGDPDALIKAVSQYRVLDFISQQPSLEEVYQTYYGIQAYAA